MRESEVLKVEPGTPLRRVLPVVSTSPGMVAHRLVLGRLRFFRSGARIYVRREDYLALCQDAWSQKVARHTRRGTEAPFEEPPPDDDERYAAPKPIHDGKITWSARLDELGRRFRRRRS